MSTCRVAVGPTGADKIVEIPSRDGGRVQAYIRQYGRFGSAEQLKSFLSTRTIQEFMGTKSASRSPARA